MNSAIKNLDLTADKREAMSIAKDIAEAIVTEVKEDLSRKGKIDADEFSCVFSEHLTQVLGGKFLPNGIIIHKTSNKRECWYIHRITQGELQIIIKEVGNTRELLSVEIEVNLRPDIEFVTYCAEKYSWCHGILTLRINDEEVVFGEGQENDRFWESGGYVDVDPDTVEKGDWEFVSPEKLPEKYQEYAQPIFDIFREYVRPGCCGGCIR